MTNRCGRIEAIVGSELALFLRATAALSNEDVKKKPCSRKSTRSVRAEQIHDREPHKDLGARASVKVGQMDRMCQQNSGRSLPADVQNSCPPAARVAAYRLVNLDCRRKTAPCGTETVVELIGVRRIRAAIAREIEQGEVAGYATGKSKGVVELVCV